MKEAQSLGIPILRRYSGGGTVYHDLGNVNYSLHRDKSFFNRTYAAEMIISALKQYNLFLSPRHDIFINKNDGSSAKISGSAYKLSKDRAYHHGTFLLSTDLTKIPNLLKSPLKIVPNDEEFKFGGVTSVPSPVSNIPDELSFDKFVQMIQDEFKPTEQIVQVSELDRNETIMTYEEELKNWNWIFGKSPPFRILLNNQLAVVEAGIIRECGDTSKIGKRLCDILNKEPLDF